MNVVDPERLASLLNADGGVRFQQDGVILKGSPFDEKRNFTGALLFAAEQLQPDECRAGTGDKTSHAEHCLIWLPYSYLKQVAPKLLSASAQKALDAEGRASLPADSANAVQRIDWMYTMLFSVQTIRRIQRKTNLRGKRIMIIYREDGETECPLIFNDGGITRFFEELKKICFVRQSSTSADEYVVQRIGSEAGTLVEAISCGITDKTAPPAHDAAAKLKAVEAFEQDLYRPDKEESRKKDAGIRGTVVSIGRQLHHQSTRIADAIADTMKAMSPVSPRFEGEENSSAGFEMIEAIQEIDCIRPIVKSTSNRKPGPPLSPQQWHDCFDEGGRLILDLFVRARVQAFFGGVDPTIRADVWKFLLNVYPLSSTAAEREEIRRARAAEYAVLKHQWMSVSEEQAANWSAFCEHRTSIEKDVLRTDRTHSAFAAENSEMLKKLRDVLRTYSMFNYDVGYCQGMSDMLAVLLLLYDDEVDAFFAFKMLLKEKCQGNFRCDAKNTLPRQMRAVETLLRAFVPTLHAFLEKRHATDMSFCFRWLLLMFKREFPVNQVMVLWDVIFACPYTSQYHIFVCAALLRAVSSQIFEQSLSYDELIKFTNVMGGVMDVRDVLSIALEFYDLVGTQMMWKCRMKAEGELLRPKLEDVLELYDASPRASSSVRSPTR